MNLEEAFTRYLRDACRDVEIVPDILPQHAITFPNADYLFNNRKFVVELKCLTDEKFPKVHSILRDLLRRGEIGNFKKGATIGEVLKCHPRREAIILEIFKKITSSFEGSFEKANRQIRETKRNMNLEEAQGVVLFVNLDNTALEPLIAARLIDKLMLQKKGNSFRYEETTFVIYISDVHYQYESEERKGMPLFINSRKPQKEISACEWAFLNGFIEIWSKFRGLPVELTKEELESIQYLSKEKVF